MPGDIVEIYDGDIIPADIRILSASGTNVVNFFSAKNRVWLFGGGAMTFNPITLGMVI